jgi:hypothetical protein
MIEFTLNGKKLQFDDSLRYADFWVDGPRNPRAVEIDMKGLLSGLQDGSISWDGDGDTLSMKDQFRLLSRWVNEAPRKRNYRNLYLTGIVNLSTEYFFEDWEDGGNFIDYLENTGHVAVAVLACYGVQPVGPIQNDDPTTPVKTSEILKL